MSFRLIRRVFYFLILLVLLAAAGLTWWTGREIASPTRRPLQDYHLEFLADPAAHGVVVEKYTLKDGTPCLMCVPESSGKLGVRGVTVRKQLEERGLLLAPAGKVIGTLVLVHGRKGRKEDYLLIAERLCAAGFRCLLADMPAHGDHPSGLAYYGVREADLPARLLSESAEKFHFDPQPVGLLGISMGGSVAMHATGQPQAPWKALCIISSFDAFDAVVDFQASRLVGSFFGGLWAAGAGWVYEAQTGQSIHAIQPHEYAARLQIPTLIAHGTKDHVVPMESGKRLFAALPETIGKKWVEIPGADHDNVLITDFPIYATLAEWMLIHVK